MPAPDSELLRAIVEHAPDAMIYSDREGVIRVWNRAAERLLGYPAAEALGRSLDLVIPEHLRAAHWAGFRAALERGRTKHAGRALNTRALRRDGSRIYLEMSFSLVFDAAGTVIGALALARAAAPRGGAA